MRSIASAMGPSFPNHMFSIAAQSGGALDNPWQPFNTLNDMLKSGLAKSWGCDIARDGYVSCAGSPRARRPPPTRTS